MHIDLPKALKGWRKVGGEDVQRDYRGSCVQELPLDLD